MKIHRKIISMLIIMVLCIGLLPVMPADIVHAAGKEFASIENWELDNGDHSTVTADGNGIKITQTKQTILKDDGVTTNSTWDSTHKLSLYNHVLSSSSDGSSILGTYGFTGKER